MIREFKNEDLDSIMKIWLETNIKAHEFIPREYWFNHLEMVKELLATSEIYVYDQDGIKGFVGIMDGYIAGIFVCDEEQSKGIGKQLIKKAKTKYHQLTLSVYEKNIQAIDFYIRQGFRVINKSIDENTGESELHMIWEIQ